MELERCCKNDEEKLQEMFGYSTNRLEKLRDEMKNTFTDAKFEALCVYACGSLGRFEMTENSDLDLFFVKQSEGELSEMMNQNVNKYEFFGEMKHINSNMGLKEPSKGGEYWVYTEEKDLLDIGSRNEDYKNSFTARLLLLLESKPVFNYLYYGKLVKKVIDSYFGDYDEHRESFYPLFLMNDVLRYWYTLALNYEYRRDLRDSDEKKNWKRLKLKYSRLLTCYSMVACLYKENISKEYVYECVEKTPIERLRMMASIYPDVQGIVDEIIKEYVQFLDMRMSMDNDFGNQRVREAAFMKADVFHHLVVKDFMGKVSEHNLALKEKVDVY